MGVQREMATLPVPGRTSLPVATAEPRKGKQRRFGDWGKVPDRSYCPEIGETISGLRRCFLERGIQI
ncbi:hypothetical protein FKM82_007348 [Ascaphus truei]